MESEVAIEPGPSERHEVGDGERCVISEELEGDGAALGDEIDARTAAGERWKEDRSNLLLVPGVRTSRSILRAPVSERGDGAHNRPLAGIGRGREGVEASDVRWTERGAV